MPMPKPSQSPPPPPTPPQQEPHAQGKAGSVDQQLQQQKHTQDVGEKGAVLSDGSKKGKGSIKGVGLVLPGGEDIEGGGEKEGMGSKVMAAVTTALNPDPGVDPKLAGLQKSGRTIGLLEDEFDPVTVRKIASGKVIFGKNTVFSTASSCIVIKKVSEGWEC